MKTHRFVLTITTDKKCTAAVALREVRDTIYGKHYCTQHDDSEPESYRIRSIQRISATLAAIADRAGRAGR